MTRSIWSRIALDAVLAACVLFGWWYLAVLIGVIALLRFPYYAELIVAGFAYDALFGMGRAADIGSMSAYAGTIVAAACTATIAILKNSIR